MIWNKIQKNLIPKSNWIWQDTRKELKEPSEIFDLNKINDDDIKSISKMVSYIDACKREEHEKYKIENGVAITGIQVGYKKRVTYLNFYDDETNRDVQYLIANPKIIKDSYQTAYLSGGEGCLSVAKKHNGIVPRKLEITFEYLDLMDLKVKTKTETGYVAIVLQHEFDHMDGKLYYDRLNIFNPDFIGDDWIKV